MADAYEEHRRHDRTSRRLVQHIDHIRSEHGDPDPTWPTSRNISDRAILNQPIAAALPLPATIETVTSSDGADRLGIRRNTVSAWIYRGRLRPVGTDDEGRKIYFLDHLTYLRDLHLARLAAREQKKIARK